MSQTIHLSPPDVGPLEESYLVAALRSGWVAPVGPDLEAFEHEIADAGRHRAAPWRSVPAPPRCTWRCSASGSAPGDVVVVPTLTFVATANAVRYTGARPVFVDCDPHDRQHRRRAARRPAAPAAVARASGSARSSRWTCSAAAPTTPRCSRSAPRPSVPVVEDAAEALGATHRGRPAGSFGRAGVLSFNGNKIMTTSGGGMLRHRRRRRSRPRPPPRPPRPASRRRTTSTARPATTTGSATCSRRSAGPSCVRLDGMIAPTPRSCATGTPSSSPRCRASSSSAREDTESNCWLTAIARRAGAVPAGRPPTWPPTWPSGTSRPGRCGSRCTCSRSYAGAESLLTGAAERLFADGLTLPSGSALTEPQIARVLGRDRRVPGRPDGRVTPRDDRTGGGRLRRPRPGGADHRPGSQRGRRPADLATAGRRRRPAQRREPETVAATRRAVPRGRGLAARRAPGHPTPHRDRRSAGPPRAIGGRIDGYDTAGREPRPPGRHHRAGHRVRAGFRRLRREPGSPRTSPSAGTCISTRTPPSATTAPRRLRLGQPARRRVR